MGRHLHLAAHLNVAALEHRYRAAHEPHERSWWQILWLLARGQTATAIADSTGYTRAWIGQIAKRDNEQGPDGMVNRRRTTSWRTSSMLSADISDPQQVNTFDSFPTQYHHLYLDVPNLRIRDFTRLDQRDVFTHATFSKLNSVEGKPCYRQQQ